MAQSLPAGMQVVNDDREEVRQVLIREAANSHSDLADDATVIYVDEWGAADLAAEELLEAGLPVAVPVGDDVPEVEDETADVHDAVVINIQVEMLRRHLSGMEPRKRLVMCLYHGVFGYPRHNQPQIARKLGLSVSQVGRLVRSGMTELQAAFGAADVS